MTAGYQQCAADRIKFNMPVVHMGYTASSTSPTALLQQAADQCALLADQLVVGVFGVSTFHYHSLLNGVALGFTETDTKVLVNGTGLGPAASDPLRYMPDIVANGNQIVIPGYFRMRSRFVDYAGFYVIHCHILAHEDRGMMTVVEVAPIRSPYSHH